MKGRISPASILIVIIVCANLLYFASCFISPSPFLLALTFACEAAYFFYFSDSKSLNSIYKDISPLLSLGKIFLYCQGSGIILSFFAFLLLEVYLIAFYKASYYFNVLASSLPKLNFKNFGSLRELSIFTERLDTFKQALFFRPLSYLVGVTLSIVPLQDSFNPLFLFCLSATILFALFLATSLRHFQYIRFGSYKKDLAAHTAHHSPEVILYVSSAPNSGYQLAQWIPVLERLEQRVTVMAREKFWITDLKDSPLHTVFARGINDIENFITSDTKICLYPANGTKNSQMMRRIELKHIFINHGESDKRVNVNRLLAAYTKLYLAGPMARDRLENSGIPLRENQYTYVGRPQTSIFLKKLPEKTGVILYAPTWEGFDTPSDYNSVGTLALPIIRLIIEHTDYTILFKPHPLTGMVKTGLRSKLSQIKNYFEETERGSYITKGDILEQMNRCDMMITDISSVMNDFLETGRPYMVTNPSSTPLAEFNESFPTVQGGYVISRANEILTNIKSIEKNDPKQDERSRVRSYSLGSFECSAMEKFQKEITADCNH